MGQLKIVVSRERLEKRLARVESDLYDAQKFYKNVEELKDPDDFRAAQGRIEYKQGYLDCLNWILKYFG
jgi:hypothetical protein